MSFLTQGKTNWKFIAIVIILAILVGGDVLWYSMRKEQVEISFSQNPSPKCSKDEDCKEGEICLKGVCHIKPIKTDETANWKTYRNEEYGFEFKYLSNSEVCDYPFLKPEANVFCRKFFLPTKEQYQKYGYKIQFGVDILGKEESKEIVEHLKNWAKGKITFNGIEFDFYEDDGVLVGMESWAPLYHYITETKGRNKKIVFWIAGFYRTKHCDQCFEKETLKYYKVYAAGPVGEHCEKCKGDLLMGKIEQEIINKMLSTFRFLE